MKRKIGPGLMIAGAVLVLLALSLYLSQLWNENKAGDAAEVALVQVKSQIGAQTGEEDAADELREMTVVTIDGWDYIGTLSVPSLGLELPVMAEWSYEGLEIAPGRYSGSVFTDDLVIAGHNYRRHFSPLKSLSAGELIVFTDMDGVAWYYEVLRLETLAPTQVEEMEGLTGEDDWDLTLFTCTTGGTARCAIRCARVDGTS
ncbi:MAG: sortase [Lachnospiraceae bacterium]|nr:sortase [Lachnospiraceae bacterium]